MKRGVKSNGVMRDTLILGGGGGRKSFTLLQGSYVLPARPSGGSGMKMKLYEEEVRMVTVVGLNKGREM